MNIIVYGLINDYNACVSFMDDLPELQYRQIRYTHTECYDDFILELNNTRYEIIAILMDGAEGMEGVIASKEIYPQSSVIWISDDEGFGVQSHRLGCTFFGTKPITEELLSSAIKRYREERIR